MSERHWASVASLTRRPCHRGEPYAGKKHAVEVGIAGQSGQLAWWHWAGAGNFCRTIGVRQHDHLRPNRPASCAATLGAAGRQQQLDERIGQPLLGASGIGAAIAPTVGLVEPIGLTLENSAKLRSTDGIDLAVDHGHAEAVVEDSQTSGLSPTLLLLVGIGRLLMFADPITHLAGEQIGRTTDSPAEQLGQLDGFR